jgi:orotidine-5'-phosphate decarboxylase
MTRNELIHQIYTKKSFLCVGLDSDLNKIPKFLLEFDDPIFEFNKQIIEHTHEHCVAYKPNIAFYEALGSKGWDSLEKTLACIPNQIFTIADAKRGDIGNTSSMYAKTFFETYKFDSITINPYMGKDSISPFLEFKDKWAIILALTSNLGSHDFQYKEDHGEKLYESVIKKSFEWGNEENIMFVTGATHASELGSIRSIAPNSFFLVPGVGAQGGDLHEVVKYGRNKEIGLLVNSSRAIIYASNQEDFALRAKEEASKMQQEMAIYF